MDGEATSQFDGEGGGFPGARTASERSFFGVVPSGEPTSPLFREGPATSIEERAFKFSSASKMFERLEPDLGGEAFKVEAEVDTEVEVELML